MLGSSSITRIFALDIIRLYLQNWSREIRGSNFPDGLFRFLDEGPMPGMEENLAGVSVHAQHAGNLAVLREVKRVIAIKLCWIGCGCCAGQIFIEISLGIAHSLICADGHLSGYV